MAAQIRKPLRGNPLGVVKKSDGMPLEVPMLLLGLALSHSSRTNPPRYGRSKNVLNGWWYQTPTTRLVRGEGWRKR